TFAWAVTASADSVLGAGTGAAAGACARLMTTAPTAARTSRTPAAPAIRGRRLPLAPSRWKVKPEAAALAPRPWAGGRGAAGAGRAAGASRRGDGTIVVSSTPAAGGRRACVSVRSTGAPVAGPAPAPRAHASATRHSR